MNHSDAGLTKIYAWPVDNAAAGWLSNDGAYAKAGDSAAIFALASVTKALFTLAILVAIEEGSLDLDQPAGPTGSTVAHLLSHSSGLARERSATTSTPAMTKVGTRRIYSNLGFEILGETLEKATQMPAKQYFHEAVVEPLQLQSTELRGSPAHGGWSSIDDLLKVAAELLKPSLISRQTLSQACEPQLGDLDGVLPGYGQQTPNLWGLGFELRGHKSPHWTSKDNSAATFGHFGASGTFLWVDPGHKLACVVLTDRKFGDWALQRWPALSGSVLNAANH